jgi:hypothetical protein
MIHPDMNSLKKINFCSFTSLDCLHGFIRHRSGKGFADRGMFDERKEVETEKGRRGESMHQHINFSTFQRINEGHTTNGARRKEGSRGEREKGRRGESTHQRINVSTHQRTTHNSRPTTQGRKKGRRGEEEMGRWGEPGNQRFNTSTFKRINASTYQLIKVSTHQLPVNQQTSQPVNQLTPERQDRFEAAPCRMAIPERGP